jgi:hypothetical protein
MAHHDPSGFGAIQSMVQHRVEDAK